MTRQRTELQNRALHRYFRQVAEALNGAGLDVRTTLAREWSIPWSDVMVKELIWRTVQEIQLAKRSTTELDTRDIDVILATVNEFLASLGIHEEFPSLESLMRAQRNEEVDNY